MKRFAFLLAAVILFTPACEDDPAEPSGPPAPRFTSDLRPSNEVPAVTNADSTGSGTMTLTLNVTRDTAGNVTAATGDFQVTLTGFPAGTVLTGAHIHPGAAGTNGNVAVNTTLANGEVTLSATGAGSFTKNGINVPVDIAQNLMNAPANYYFNVHTQLNLQGAVRGQLVRTQ
jgi:hypothetical protein